jgi:hypothetical protein
VKPCCAVLILERIQMVFCGLDLDWPFAGDAKNPIYPPYSRARMVKKELKAGEEIIESAR